MRQRGQVNARIFLLHGLLGALIFLVAQSRIFVLCRLQHTIFLYGQRLSFVGQWQVALGEQCQIARAVGHHVVDVYQQVSLILRFHHLHANQRFVAHYVERSAESMMRISVELLVRHLVPRYHQLLRVVHKLSRFAIVVYQETDAQLRSRLIDSLHRFFHTVRVHIVRQGHDAWNVILHHMRILQTVVKHTQL